MYDQAAHYGADHGADDESLDVHCTSPLNNNLHQRNLLRVSYPYPNPWRPGDGSLARRAGG